MRETIGAQMRPPGTPARLYVRWAQLEKPLDVTLLESVGYALDVHWVRLPNVKARVSKRCMQPQKCQYCGIGIERSTLAYLGAWSHRDRCPIITVYGPDSWARLDGLSIGAEPLRGIRLLMTRDSSGASGPVLMQRQRYPLSPLIECPDIRPCLRGLFGEDLWQDDPADNGMGDAWEADK